ncbi:hypothetical protein O0I10_009080 [Lichtheimia ornata]|uniref:Uncharacterized protein n=1 Tax=Lichtheimia ornata TaxID=688661 RepID=A0AAD7UXD2_9FUNG|nr:uncharacterized protein O0I10_009080 [Lichtheimia ornata]KAJ8655212.1 hypothetical protein O0I10_009080 [Lichtheimia ornata]
MPNNSRHATSNAATNTDLRHLEEINATWNKCFLTAASKFNIKIVSKDQPNCEKIYEAILQARVEEHTSSASTTSGETDSCMLDPSAKARFCS